MDSFIVYPAIDLRNGKVVRLQEGDPDRQTTYDSDPARIARRWFEAGAGWLHVVNLDGAFGERGAENLPAPGTTIDQSMRVPPPAPGTTIDQSMRPQPPAPGTTIDQSMRPQPQILQSILQVAKTFGGKVQFGGGLRTLEQIQTVLDAGVSRVLLGTAVIASPALTAEALAAWGAERIGAALDARDGKIRISGWQQDTGMDANQVGQSLYRLGLRTVIFTNIARDGMGTGADIRAAQALAAQSGLKVIASGGVRSLDDVRQARQAGLAGIIIGKALYENAIDLTEALRLC